MTLPEPYFDDGQITIYHADCRDVLPTLDLSDVGLVLTDPPYGIAYDATHTKYHNGTNYGATEWDTAPYDPTPILDLNKPSIVWGANCFASRLPDEKAWISWVKIVRQDAKIRQSDFELAWTNCLSRNRVFTHLWIGAYRDSESGVPNVHPTQKPIALMKWCIEVAKKSGTVLDPYMGSGTTLRAAKDLGRRAIGIEISEAYCEIAVRRLQQAVLPLEIA